VYLHLERREHAAWIVIDRPGARNALSFEMWDRLGEIARELSRDSTLRAVIIAGGPEAFAAGADIAEFTSFAGADDGFAYEARVESVLRAIEDLQVPTIAALAGACTGGGVFLASACDLRIGAANLRVGVPIARTLGNVTTVANVRRLGAIIGLARVKEWFMTARLLDASRALAAGFIGEVVPSFDALAPRAEQLASELAGYAPRTLRATKELYRRILRDGGEIDDRDILESCYASADFREGVAAFFEKRPAAWRDL
jgi:enoyl-CoA hydratase/carnithine racemase